MLSSTPRACETALAMRQNDTCAHPRAMASAMETVMIARWRLQLTNPNPDPNFNPAVSISCHPARGPKAFIRRLR